MVDCRSSSGLEGSAPGMGVGAMVSVWEWCSAGRREGAEVDMVIDWFKLK